MIDVDQLPIPDWDLRCPGCDAPLAGLRVHCCRGCGEPFDVRQVLAQHRPIADVGLTCPGCGHPLRGLENEECPVCDTEFSLREMLAVDGPLAPYHATQLTDPEDHHVKKRPPALTGNERPLPDFGLACAGCGEPLAGAPGDVCPECGLAFDLSGMVGDGDWVDVSEFVPRGLRALARTILYGAQVPYLMDNRRLHELYGGRVPFVSGGLRVPREFFFDALEAFASAEEPPADYAREEWVCPSCDETVPAGFEVCWSCGAAHPDQSADEAED